MKPNLAILNQALNALTSFFNNLISLFAIRAIKLISPKTVNTLI